jgi:hypothetical protein
VSHSGWLCACVRYIKELGLQDVELINLDVHKETKTADYLKVKVTCLGCIMHCMASMMHYVLILNCLAFDETC